ncbi:MAG: M48 family metallopeptidase [Proteobacteria bacterium]|nr:M48 family metallopeptidase [Pseudomonadota bacterium]
MEYSNPKIPEGINTTVENPLKEFFILSVGVLGIIFFAVIILSLAAEKLAIYIPFNIEQDLIPEMWAQAEPETESETNRQTREYLQSLSDQLADHMQLPEEMEITVHYIEGDTVNAFATIGGHIFIYQGLLDELESENALAMVIAHEVAHIFHRHPIIAMGRGVVIGLLLSAISGASGDLFVGQIVSETGMIALLNFTRDQEREADITALTAVNGLYHHVAGTNDLFRVLMAAHDLESIEPPLFLSTHPLTQDRIDDLTQYAHGQGWTTEATLAPFPQELR